MYRFLLSRRWLGLLLAVLVATAVCVLLGRWQLERLAERHERNDLLSRNLDRPAAAPADVVAVGREPEAGDEYRRVRASGRYDVEHQLLVRLRPRDGEVGFEVLTPLVTTAGPALLVNRGWVPGGEGVGGRPDVPAPPGGTVSVTARLRSSEPPSTTGTPPQGQVTRIDVPRIARSIPYAVYGGYVELVAERPAPLEAPRLLPPPEPSEGPHLAYAFQWFLFGVIALGGFVVLSRREAKDQTSAAQPERRSSVADPVRG